MLTLQRAVMFTSKLTKLCKKGLHISIKPVIIVYIIIKPVIIIYIIIKPVTARQ